MSPAPPDEPDSADDDRVATIRDALVETARHAYDNPHVDMPLVMTDEQAAELGLSPGSYVTPRPVERVALPRRPRRPPW